MKRFLLPAALLVLQGTLYSQICTPDTTKSATGNYPDGGTVDTVYVGLQYQENITFVSLKDTTMVVSINPYPPTTVNARLDSVRIRNWSDPVTLNLPPGLQAACNIGNCTFPGGSRNCVRISGLVSDPLDTGSYDLNLEVTYYFTIMSAPFTGINYSLPATYSPFRMFVRSQPPSGRNYRPVTAVPQVFPNPSGEYFHIGNLPENTECEFAVRDLTGRELFSSVHRGKETRLQWPAYTLPGVYLLSVKPVGQAASVIPVIKN